MARVRRAALAALVVFAALGPARPQSPRHAAATRTAAGAYHSDFRTPSRGSGGTLLRGPHGPAALRWAVRTGHRVFASPVRNAEGWAVVGSVDGTVVAVDATGVVRWSSRRRSRVFASPAVHGDLVFGGSDAREAFGLAGRGEERWRAIVPQDLAAPLLVIDGGTVLAVSGDARAYSLDGTLRWTTTLAGHAFGAPAEADARGFVAEMRGSVAVLDARSGTLERRVELGGFAYGGVLAMPDGGFIVGVADGTVRRFGRDGEARWSVRTDGAARSLGVRSTPALRGDGVVVVGAEDGNVYGLRGDDGSRVFAVRTFGAVRSRACIDRDGWTYVGSEDDAVHAIAPDGVEAWRVNVGADVDSGPALLADGLLVVGADDGALHAIGDAAPVAP